MKNHGFGQAVHATSTTAKERVGTLRTLRDGRKFRYTKNGAVALVAGTALMPAANNTNLQNQALGAAGAASVGDTEVVFTVGAAITVAEDYFKGGTFHVIDGAGQGHTYEIDGSSVMAAATALTLKLAEPLRFAIVAADEGSVHPHQNMATVVTTGVTVPCCGVAHVAVAANSYFWAQTRGPVSCLNTAGSSIYETVGPTAAGSVVTVTTPLDVDQTVIGTAMCAAAAGDYGAVMLTID